MAPNSLLNPDRLQRTVDSVCFGGMSTLSLPRAALQSQSEDELLGTIVDEFGLYVRIADAWQALGFRSLEAARRAAVQGRLGVDVVHMPGRRGRVVPSQALARWLFEASRSRPQ